ncbi:putative RNA-directed DNA polymerase [Tanacetum coccineum]
MIELWADVELKDTIVMAMPRLVEEGFYTCTIRFKYERKSPRCACCKVFGHVQDECPKYRSSDVKNPSQAPKSFLVGPKVGFQPFKQVFRPISKKNNGNTSCNKKKNVESRKENVKSSSPSTTPIGDKIDKR